MLRSFFPGSPVPFCERAQGCTPNKYSLHNWSVQQQLQQCSAAASAVFSSSFSSFSSCDSLSSLDNFSSFGSFSSLDSFSSLSVGLAISVISVNGWHELFELHSYRCNID
jgi:hypothetical protein